jgi:hypothetical protein
MATGVFRLTEKVSETWPKNNSSLPKPDTIKHISTTLHLLTVQGLWNNPLETKCREKKKLKQILFLVSSIAFFQYRESEIEQR